MCIGCCFCLLLDHGLSCAGIRPCDNFLLCSSLQPVSWIHKAHQQSPQGINWGRYIIWHTHCTVSWLSVEQWQVNLRGWGVADGVWRGRGRKRGIPIPLASIHGCIITHNRMGDRACVMRALTHIMTLYNYCARGHVLYRTLVILFLLPRRQLRVLKTSGLLLHSALNTDFIASFMMKWKVLISELYTVHIYMCGFLSGSPCHAGYIIYFYMLVYYSLAK